MSATFQSGFTTTLTAPLTASDVTMTVATAPGVTIGRVFLTNGIQKEWISFTGVSGLTLTGLTRGLTQTDDPAVAGTGYAWIAGTQVTLVAMHDQLIDKQQGTTIQGFTTVQRSALTIPSGKSTIVYNTDTGVNEQYIGGTWTTFATGTTANASTTVAGKVEIATTAESIAGTDTGGTGAKLSALPSDIAANTQSSTFVFGTDTGGDDTYVVALTPTLAAYTTGQQLFFKPTTGNTGACSVDFGPGVLNIKTKDGNDPQTGVIRAGKVVSGHYDGTNFVLDNEDFSTTSNKGIITTAANSDAAAGTDTAKAITSSQLKTYAGYNKVMTTTFTDTLSNFDLGIPHATYTTIVVHFTIMGPDYNYLNTTGSLYITGTHGSNIIVGQAASAGVYGAGYSGMIQSTSSASTWVQYVDASAEDTITLNKGASNYQISYTNILGGGRAFTAIFDIHYIQ